MLNISITYLILNRCGNFCRKKNAWLNKPSVFGGVNCGVKGLSRVRKVLKGDLFSFDPS